MKDGGKALASPFSRFVLAGMIAAFIVCAVIVFNWVDFSNASAAVNFFLSLVTLTFSILLYTFCSNIVPGNEEERHFLSVAVISYYLCVLSLFLYSGSEGNPRMWQVTKLLYTVLYLLSAVYWLIFWFFQKKLYRRRISDRLIESVIFVLFSVYCTLTIINYFTGFCFTILPDGSFVVRSALLYILTVFCIVLYFFVTMLTVCPAKTRRIFASFSLFPLLTWIPVFLLPPSPFYANIFSNFALFSNLIPLYLLFFNVYLESEQRLLRRELELVESRTKAMALQISPHFISNTMSSIVALCYPNAPEAGDLATKFACYLRDNYTNITDEPMTFFAEELAHIRNYLAVEQVRFPGLRVEYDIQSDNFLLPTLTVQPLVENAVRHGISKRRPASGTVKISSFEKPDSYIIRIEDDGVGYRPIQPEGGRKHVGIANARTRLELLCAGTLTLAERPGQGTICEITIPKGAKL